MEEIPVQERERSTMKSCDMGKVWEVSKGAKAELPTCEMNGKKDRANGMNIRSGADGLVYIVGNRSRWTQINS